MILSKKELRLIASSLCEDIRFLESHEGKYIVRAKEDLNKVLVKIRAELKILRAE